MEHQFRRTYRTHRSFVPLTISFIEKKPETLEKLVSFLALKMVIAKVKPEAVCEKEHDIYLQTRVSGIEDVDGLYNYFLKKGLSQSEVTHRLKRVKFLKLINDSVYIIPPIEIVTLPVEDAPRVIEIHEHPVEIVKKVEPLVQIVKAPVKIVEEPKVPVVITTSMSQAITEFTKVLIHSGFKEINRDKNGRKFTGMGHSINLKVLEKEKFKLDIDEDGSSNGTIIPYNKNKTSGNYLHIIGHTFGAINYLMTRAEFTVNKARSSKFTKVYNRQDYTVILKWMEDSTNIELLRSITKSAYDKDFNKLPLEEQKFLNRIP